MIALFEKYKSISKDFLFNITASLVLTGIMQIVVYPLLAYKLSSAEYGELLTIMGIVNTIIVALGNSLNNVRLIEKNKYDAEGLVGDYNILIACASIAGCILVALLSICVFKQSVFLAVSLSIVVCLGILKSYYCVQFRIVLNFKKILIQNIIGATGYIIGSLLLFQILFWPIPFIIAELVQLLYIFSNSDLHKEPLKRTPLFVLTTNKYFILIISGLSTTLITYLDRLIIFPLLGGDSVSTYTVAAFFGKTLGIVMTPIAGVLLAYYSQKGFRMTKSRFWGINGASFVFALAFLLVASFLAPFITRLLYPTIFEAAEPYIFVANTAATINVLCQLAQAAILKFAPTWLQIVKEFGYCVAYLACGYLLLNSFGLMGFCFAAIVANTVKLLLLYLIGSIYIQDSGEVKK